MQNMFLESFKPKNIIDNPSIEELKELSLKQGGIITEFGNLSVVTSVRNRIAKFTEVIMGEPGLNSLVNDVMDYLKNKEMIARDRIIWKRDEFWGYDVPEEIPGVDMQRFNLENFYDEDGVRELSHKLKSERLDWLGQFKGLDPEILNALKP